MIFTVVWDMWYWKVCFDLIWFDLIWFDLIRHSKSHWKQHSLWRRIILLYCWFASNKYFSISFPFSRFRCSCSRKSHSGKVVLFEKLEKTAFLSLAGRRRRKSSSAVVEIFVCLIATNFNHSANPIAREFHPVWQMRKITLFFLSFFLEFHQILRISRFQTSFHISRFQQSSNQKEERKQSKFKTCFANAVEISIISTNLIKITLSQTTIYQNDDCFRFSNM